jgi:hypothetical protein
MRGLIVIGAISVVALVVGKAEGQLAKPVLECPNDCIVPCVTY